MAHEVGLIPEYEELYICTAVQLRCCSRLSCWWLSSSVWRWSSSAEVSFQRHPEAARATNTQQTWRQEFLVSRSSTVERSSTRTAAAGTFLPFLQTIFENTSLWRLKRLVTLSTYRPYINKFYLSIYLSRPIYLSTYAGKHIMHKI